MNLIKDLSKLDCIIISKALIDIWNTNTPVPLLPAGNILNNYYPNHECIENRKNKYINVLTDILIDITNKEQKDLINYLCNITNYINDNIRHIDNFNGEMINTIGDFNNMNIYNLMDVSNSSYINFNYKLYNSTKIFFDNYFNLDNDEKTLRKSKYIISLNDILSKNTITETDVYTLNKGITSFRNIAINNVNINKNEIIKFISTKMYISDYESIVLINKLFNINYVNTANYVINYVLFYEIINILTM